MERSLRLSAVAEKIGLRRSTIFEAVRRGELKPPVRVLGRVVAWNQRDVDDYIRSRPTAYARRKLRGHSVQERLSSRTRRTPEEGGAQ